MNWVLLGVAPSWPPLFSFVNGAPLGRPDAGVDMTFDFGQLISHAARTRALSAGTIIGSGAVSNCSADAAPAGQLRLAEWAIPAWLSSGSSRDFWKAKSSHRF